MSVVPEPYWNPSTQAQDEEACIAACQSRYPITCYLPGRLSCSCVDGCREGEPPASGLFGSGYEVQDIAGGAWEYGQEALESIGRAAIPVAVIVVGGLVLYLLILRS